VISVIVPTLNEAEVIGRTLNSIRRLGGEHEIVVSDGGSTDGTIEIVESQAGVTLVRSPRGRGTQLNRGAEAARGETLLFLHADTIPPPGAFKLIKETLRRPGVVAGSFRLRFDHPSPVLRFYAAMSRFNHILTTYGDQGLFMRAETFRAIGGFKEIPLLEDVEIQQRLRRLGGFAKLPVSVTTSARRFIEHGVLRQQLLNAALVVLYHLGVPPDLLSRLYG